MNYDVTYGEAPGSVVITLASILNGSETVAASSGTWHMSSKLENLCDKPLWDIGLCMNHFVEEMEDLMIEVPEIKELLRRAELALAPSTPLISSDMKDDEQKDSVHALILLSADCNMIDSY